MSIPRVWYYLGNYGEYAIPEPQNTRFNALPQTASGELDMRFSVCREADAWMTKYGEERDAALARRAA